MMTSSEFHTSGAGSDDGRFLCQNACLSSTKTLPPNIQQSRYRAPPVPCYLMQTACTVVVSDLSGPAAQQAHIFWSPPRFHSQYNRLLNFPWPYTCGILLRYWNHIFPQVATLDICGTIRYNISTTIHTFINCAYTSKNQNNSSDPNAARTAQIFLVLPKLNVVVVVVCTVSNQFDFHYKKSDCDSKRWDQSSKSMSEFFYLGREDEKKSNTLLGQAKLYIFFLPPMLFFRRRTLQIGQKLVYKLNI